MLEPPESSTLAQDKRGRMQAVTRPREPVCDVGQSQTEERVSRTRTIRPSEKSGGPGGAWLSLVG